MQEKKNSLYNPTIDILRIIAILAVICIHTTTRTLEASSNDIVRLPWTYFLNQSLRFAVPMFFFISGFVLELQYVHNNYMQYITKRIRRIFIPYIFWSIIYFHFVFNNLPFPLFSLQFVHLLLVGGASYQLYFIPALLIFYLFFPIIHKLYPFLRNVWVLFFLGVVEITLLGYDYYSVPLGVSLPIRIALLNFYPFILGLVSTHYENRIERVLSVWKTGIYFVTIGLLSYIIYESKTLFLKNHNYLWFYSQWRPNILLYSLCVTGILYPILFHIRVSFTTIQLFAKLSFFVFFVHIIFLIVLWGTLGELLIYQTNGHIIENILFDPTYFLLVTFFSFSMAYIIHKIPLIDKITG